VAFLIISCGTALWLRSCLHHQRRAAAAAAGGTTESGHAGFRMMIPLRKPVTTTGMSGINGSATVTGGPDNSYQMTTVAGSSSYHHPHYNQKQSLVTSSDKSGQHVMTSLSRPPASGNAKRPADRRGFTPTATNSSSPVTTTAGSSKDKLLLPDQLLQSSQHKLKHKLISIFWHRR